MASFCNGKTSTHVFFRQFQVNRVSPSSFILVQVMAQVPMASGRAPKRQPAGKAKPKPAAGEGGDGSGGGFDVGPWISGIQMMAAEDVFVDDGSAGNPRAVNAKHVQDIIDELTENPPQEINLTTWCNRGVCLMPLLQWCPV